MQKKSQRFFLITISLIICLNRFGIFNIFSLKNNSNFLPYTQEENPQKNAHLGKIIKPQLQLTLLAWKTDNNRIEENINYYINYSANWPKFSIQNQII